MLLCISRAIPSEWLHVLMVSEFQMLIDSHAHLDAHQFDDDRDAVLGRAADAGVRVVVNVGYNAATWPTTLALAAAHPGIFACLGFHPNDTADWDETIIPALAVLHRDPKAVAVGETGLDYYRDYAPPEQQRTAFRAQLALARRLGKPVVIHHREAHDDLLTILREEVAAHGPLNGVLHAFSGGPGFAAQLLNLGLHLGIGGPVTFKNATDLHEAVRGAPLDRLLIETDSPYLAPHPHRGKRNESAYVALVAARIAVLRGMDEAEIGRITTENALRFFGIILPNALL
jgi:TatD DNase family protein